MGPPWLMVTPEPMNSPVPITPPSDSMKMCRLFSARVSWIFSRLSVMAHLAFAAGARPRGGAARCVGKEGLSATACHYSCLQ
ncbi:hypothetical protein D3C78_531390 [compost metagenome]